MLSRGHHLSLVFLMSVLVSMLASLSLWSLSFVLSVFLSRFCSPSLMFVFVLNDSSNNKHCLSLVSVFVVFVTLVPRHYSINVCVQCVASYFCLVHFINDPQSVVTPYTTPPRIQISVFKTQR